MPGAHRGLLPSQYVRPDTNGAACGSCFACAASTGPLFFTLLYSAASPRGGIVAAPSSGDSIAAVPQLNYLANSTWPDIGAAQCSLARSHPDSRIINLGVCSASVPRRRQSFVSSSFCTLFVVHCLLVRLCASARQCSLHSVQTAALVCAFELLLVAVFAVAHN